MRRVCVVGAINQDVTLFVEDLPRVGEEVSVKRIIRTPGGKGANVAVAAARILGRDRVSLLGALGRDAVAQERLAVLREEGVDASGVKLTKDAESGQAYIAVDRNGRNVILTHFGANLCILPEDLKQPARRAILEQASILVIIDPPLPTCESLAELGRGSGRVILFNPGVRCRLGIDGLKKVLSNADYVVMNEIEAAELTGARTPERVRGALTGFNSAIKVVVTMGARGCLLVGDTGVAREGGVPLKRLGMKAVSTVGCGDAFFGAFAAAKAEGLPDITALKRANFAGAYNATKTETRGSPSRQELEAIMAKFEAYT